MEIILDKVSRKYNYEWIFRNVNYRFISGKSYAVLGSNGSGKSTLLQIISGHLHPTGGTITFQNNGSVISDDQVFRNVTITGPYVELIEEFTLTEMVSFHMKFRNFRNGINTSQLIDITELGRNKDKALKYYSSGMKQRVKLALAILSDVPVVLLDEPASNLDASGIEWYRSLVSANSADRIFIICSNSQPGEHDFCNESLFINNYKGKPQK
jgi:ABC-type multidrug transport system ATPase subunit